MIKNATATIISKTMQTKAENAHETKVNLIARIASLNFVIILTEKRTCHIGIIFFPHEQEARTSIENAFLTTSIKKYQNPDFVPVASPKNNPYLYPNFNVTPLIDIIETKNEKHIKAAKTYTFGLFLRKSSTMSDIIQYK